MKKKIVQYFYKKWLGIKKYFLGPSFYVNEKKTKEKDPNNILIAVSLAFSVAFAFIINGADKVIRDVVNTFQTMFSSAVGIAVALSLVALIGTLMGLGIYFISKKKYVCISDSICLPIFAFMLYFVIIQSFNYGISKDNWLIYLVMIAPQYVLLFGLFTRCLRFALKWSLGKISDDRELDYAYRLQLRRKTFTRIGLYFKNKWGQMLIVLALIIFAVSVLYPLIILLMRSFKYPIDDLKYPFDIPTVITFENYTFMWEYLKGAFINSLVTTICVTIGTMVLASLLGYAFIRFHFPLKNVIFYLIIGLMMIPGILTLISRFQVVNSMKLTGSLAGIILPGIAGFVPGSFMLLFTFFKGIPKDLFEAADIDGANDLSVFARIVVPLSKPILSTIAIQTFVGEWNDYLWASLIVGNDESLYTLPVLLQRLSSSYEQSGLGMSTPFAGYVLSAIPMVLIFIVASKQFIEGLTSGAFKM